MSEKRFNIAYGGNVVTDRDGRDLNLSVKWCVEELVDKLNELDDENKQLRQKLDFYLLDEFEWKEKYGD